MIQSIAQFILFRCLGWKVETTVPARDKCILCVAPHTSNWDFLLGETFSQAIGRKAGFLMKKEWFFWPLGSLFRALGGIPVVRSRHQSLTDQLADIAIRETYFNLAVTPEGTRSRCHQLETRFLLYCLEGEYPHSIVCYRCKA